MSRLRNVLLAVVLGCLVAVFASSDVLAAEFIGSSDDRAGSAWFDVDEAADRLIVTLSNAASVEAANGNDVLTAVFFNSTVPLQLERSGAVLGANSVVLNPSQFGDGTDPNIANGVGGEWAYRDDLTADILEGTELTDQQYGISSTGLKSDFLGTRTFSASDRFPGVNLAGNSNGNPSGISYGLVSPSTTDTSGNKTIQQRETIRDSVVFEFSFVGGVPQGFEPGLDITDVVFQYGNRYGRPQVAAETTYVSAFANPEPVTAALSLMGLGAIVIRCGGRSRRVDTI